MYNHKPNDYQCPLCIFSAGGETEYNKRGDIVYEDEEMMAYISPKWWPHNPGNVMIIPKQHFENVYDLPDELLGKLYILGKKIMLGIKETYDCEGTSLRQHNEPAGGQNVWHFHLHIFPRHVRDNLYQDTDKSRYITEEERKPYAEKLKKYFQ